MNKRIPKYVEGIKMASDLVYNEVVLQHQELKAARQALKSVLKSRDPKSVARTFFNTYGEEK